MENNEKSTLADKAAGKIKYSPGYIVLLIVIVGLCHVLDEYSSLAPSYYASAVITEYFVQTGWMDYQSALGFTSLLGMVSLPLFALGFLYKAQMDKIGRKPIFIVSAIGMVIGVVIMIFSMNYYVYYIGSVFLTFFIANDMQYQYINEETPTKWRGQFFSYAKILGLLGLLLVPLIYSLNVEGDTVNWRPILYVPVIIGMVVIVLSIFLLKETRAFRIMQEERILDPNKYKEEKVNFKLTFQRMKKMSTWSQQKWLIILTTIGVLFAALNQQYTDHFAEQVGILEIDRPIIQTFSTIFVGVAYLAQGLISDRIGRKPAYIMNAILVLVLLPVEYFAMLNHNLILAGISQGLRIGAFWNAGDVNGFMFIENVPTRFRGTALSIRGFYMFLGILLVIPINVAFVPAFPYTQQALMIVGMPIMIFTLIIVFWKLKETKNVDITKIEG